MDNQDPELTQAHSYPSPNAAQMSQGTNYYQQAQRPYPSSEEMQLHQLAELGRDSGSTLHDSLVRAAAGATNNPADSNGAQQATEHHTQHLHQSPAELTAAAAVAVASANGANANQQQDVVMTTPQQHHAQMTPQQQQGLMPSRDSVGLDPYGGDSSRKRSKTSRACDECRRKKVRCDASTDSDKHPCKNCEDKKIPCQFTRTPMKRGPSKGYIQMIADRLETLERKENQGGHGLSAGMSYPHDFASDGHDYPDLGNSVDNTPLVRKRTFSMSEDANNAFAQRPYSQRGLQAPGTWGPGGYTQAISMNDRFPDAQGFQPPVDANGSFQAAEPFWAAQSNLRQAGGEARGSVLEREGGLWNERAIDIYYERVHNFLPVLSENKETFFTSLQSCDRPTQEAFFQGLYSFTNMAQAMAGHYQQLRTLDAAQQYIAGTISEDENARTTITSLVHLQSLLLMILGADAIGPDSFQGHDGFDKKFLLSMAYLRGHSLLKRVERLKASQAADLDGDSVGNNARRSWVALGVLSRWQASATSGPDVFGSHEIGVLEDEKILSWNTLQLARMSTILSETHELLLDSTLSSSPGSALSRPINRLLQGQLTLVKMLASSSGTDVLHLAQQYLTLLVKRHTSIQNPQDVVSTAEELAYTLSADAYPFSPFHLPIVALTALTLAESASLSVAETSEAVSRGLQALAKALSTRETLSTTSDSETPLFTTSKWDSKIADLIQQKLAEVQATIAKRNSSSFNATQQESLKQLADLATSTAGDGASTTADGTAPQVNGAGKTTASPILTAAAAAAVAAGKAIGTSQQGQAQAQAKDGEGLNGIGNVDFTRAVRRGVLNVLGEI